MSAFASALSPVLRRLDPERARAERLIEGRGRDARTARWLAARGFDAAVVEDVVGELQTGADRE